MFPAKTVPLHESGPWTDRVWSLLSTRDSRWLYTLALYPALIALPYFFVVDGFGSWARLAYLLGCALLAAAFMLVMLARRTQPLYQWLDARAGRILGLVVAAYALVLFYLAYWVRLRNGIGMVEDIAMLEQPLWTTNHGAFLYSSFFTGGSYFTLHFAPILALFSAVYAVIPDIGAIFAIQTLLLSLTAVPLYLLAKEALGKVAALVLAVAFLVQPAVVSQHFNLYLNHFAPFFWVSAALAFQRKNLLVFFLFGILAAAVQEDIAFSLLVFALLAWLDRRSVAWKIVTLVLPLGWFVTGMGIMQFNSSITGIALGGHLRDLGTTPSQVSQSAVSNPGVIVNKLFAGAPAKFLWAYELLTPVLLVAPLASPMFLAALPDGGVFSLLNLPSDQYSVKWYFSLFIATVLFTALVLGLGRVVRGIRDERVKLKLPRVASVLVLCSSLAVLPLVVNPSMFGGSDGGRQAAAQKIQALVSPNDCLAATPDVVSFFAQRYHLMWLDYSGSRADGCQYIVVGQQYADQLPAGSSVKAFIGQVASGGRYTLLFSENQVQLYGLK